MFFIGLGGYNIRFFFDSNEGSRFSGRCKESKQPEFYREGREAREAAAGAKLGSKSRASSIFKSLAEGFFYSSLPA
jgi:hypothetical protein